MKLHFGCGAVIKEGWTNADHWTPDCVSLGLTGLHVERDRVWTNSGSGQTTNEEVTRFVKLKAPNDLSCIGGGTVEEIYSSHVLEHFHPSVLQELLGEFQRVLKPGGKMHHITPDFDEMVKLWVSLNQGWKNGESVMDMERYQTIVNVTLCPFLFGDNYPQHKALLNKNVMEFLLRRWGFDKVKVETKGTDLHSTCHSPSGIYNTLRVKK
jgi:predicted SAM-dependent methyltransferase